MRVRLSWALGVAAALFYLCFHSSYYNFDGVACAIAVELGDWNHLVHGNHLAYGVVGLFFDRLWRLFGYKGQAILSLQVLDSILGGLGVGLFYRLLEKLKFERALCVSGALALGFSQCYWFWSLEAQVYLLGAVFVILAATEGLSEKPRPARLGFWLAGAALGHVGHVMLVPSAAYCLWKSGAKRKDFFFAGAAFALALAAAYGAAALFAVRPATHEGWRLWLLGSAALTVERSFTWHGGYSFAALAAWIKTTGRLLVSPRDAEISNLGLCLGLLPFLPASYAAVRARRTARAGLAAAALIWLASYALLFVSWQPFLDVYRISDLVPILLLALIGLEAFPKKAAAAGAFVWLAAVGGFNASRNILPRADASANPDYEEAVWLGAHTAEDALIVVTARGQVYVPYFAHRRPLNLRYYEKRADLFRKLDELSAGGKPVFVTDTTLRESDLGLDLADYGLEQVKPGEAGFLYRVKRKESPAAGRKKSSGSPPR